MRALSMGVARGTSNPPGHLKHTHTYTVRREKYASLPSVVCGRAGAEHCLLLRPVHSLGALPTAARRCTSTARSSRAGRGARPATPRPPHMLCTSCRPVPVHRLATLAIAFRNAEQRSPYGSMGRGVGLESQICQRLLRLRWGRPSSLHTPLHCIPRARPSLQVR